MKNLGKKRVFVISDLHLGGMPDAYDENQNMVKVGSQICDSYSELTSFVDWLSENCEEYSGNTELVVNGDIVDFLAPDLDAASAFTYDEDIVIEKLDQIILRSRECGQRGIFDAWKDFLKNGGMLTFILGNHDVELSLPKVRRHLDKFFESENFKFVYDGEAYQINRVLIEHGNRYDGFNRLDFCGLRQQRSQLSRGLKEDDYFQAPPGSFMVVEIINKIKKEYRFIDLLKPEQEAVVPLLLTLAPFSIVYLRQLVPHILEARKIGRNLSPATPENKGYLGAGNISMTEENFFKELFREDFDLFEEIVRRNEKSTLSSNSADGLFSKYFSELKSALEKIGLVTSSGQLGPLEKRLFYSLRRLKEDSTFLVDSERREYLEAASEMINTGQFDLVVFGHTHLPKKIKIDRKGGDYPATYYNSGSWANVIEIPKELFADDSESLAEFKSFCMAMKNNDYQKYIKKYLSFVFIEMDGDQILDSDLFSYCGRSREKEKPLVSYSK